MALRVGGLTDGLVEEEGLADVFDLRDCAFEIEGFGEDDFEDLGEIRVVLVRSLAGWNEGGRGDEEGRERGLGVWMGRFMHLLYVDAVACAAEYEACSHGFCEAAGLV